VTLVLTEHILVKHEKWHLLCLQVAEKVPIFIFDGYRRDSYLATMMDAGNESEHSLIASIRQASNGDILFSQEQYGRATHWRNMAGKKWYT
jgi:hypothetical protein